MARRDHRVGLATTTISVKLTAPELEALDGERKYSEGLFNSERTGRPVRFFHEGRGEALRRLISEAYERRVDLVKRSDPRQVTLTEAIEAEAARPPAGKTEPAAKGQASTGKTGRRRARPLTATEKRALWKRSEARAARIRR